MKTCSRIFPIAKHRVTSGGGTKGYRSENKEEKHGEQNYKARTFADMLGDCLKTHSEYGEVKVGTKIPT